MGDKRKNRFNMTITDEEKRIIAFLKKEYSINISSYFRRSIKDLYESMEINGKSKKDRKQLRE